MRRPTSASISLLGMDASKAGSLHLGRLRTHAGQSHSCDLPTSEPPSPKAQTISVPLASRETIRIHLHFTGSAPSPSRLSRLQFLHDSLDGTYSAFRPQLPALDLRNALYFVDEVDQALEIRLGHPRPPLDMRIRQKARVVAEIDAQVVARFVIKFRTETFEGHASGRKLPISVKLPEVPCSVDLEQAILVAELLRGGDDVFRIDPRRELPFELRGLQLLDGVNPKHGTPRGQLRMGKNAQHSFELAEHVVCREPANPAGQIKAVGHLSHHCFQGLQCAVHVVLGVVNVRRETKAVQVAVLGAGDRHAIPLPERV